MPSEGVDGAIRDGSHRLSDLFRLPEAARGGEMQQWAKEQAIRAASGLPPTEPPFLP